jgi:hypothetical protein
VLFCFAHEAAGAIGIRLSLRPCFFEGTFLDQACGFSCRESAQARLLTNQVN